ncbi:MAG: class III signal peptide-containing protein [Methanobrevibacter sp.]|uniref:class III signal peptide-containing protein n=1 Tax=Methanobrevibacter sp. TaxID=66852 RepID=UPI001B3CF562|nr:class III signal peptide-containing protein [Methanobrevibacter sp.]MBP3791697.1 class III signal peptide-containing protein [Methanobrevibacter sp.]
MTDNNGQVSAEFLFLFGVLILIVMLAIVFVAQEQELNTAMAAARNGANEGLSTSSSAIYPEDTYRDYSTSKTTLLFPYSVEIVNVSYTDLGYDANYDKKRVQFKVYAKTSDRFSHDELVSIGDRINYNLRKSVAISFNSTSATNKLYNPVFSPHYVYTTANVKWV